jgi:hypothetical protein
MRQGQQCPECGDPSSFCITYSRMVRGRRRRRRHCKSCGFLSVDFDGEQVEPPGRPGALRRFTREQIAQIVMLKGHQTQRLTAQQFGCSGEAIRQIWTGQTYSDWTGISYRPPLRPGEPSCEQCQHWETGRCGMGLPDPEEEGPGFARDCSLFEEA